MLYCYNDISCTLKSAKSMLWRQKSGDYLTLYYTIKIYLHKNYILNNNLKGTVEKKIIIITTKKMIVLIYFLFAINNYFLILKKIKENKKSETKCL